MEETDRLDQRRVVLMTGVAATMRKTSSPSVAASTRTQPKAVEAVLTLAAERNQERVTAIVMAITRNSTMGTRMMAMIMMAMIVTMMATAEQDKENRATKVIQLMNILTSWMSTKREEMSHKGHPRQQEKTMADRKNGKSHAKNSGEETMAATEEAVANPSEDMKQAEQENTSPEVDWHRMITTRKRNPGTLKPESTS